MDLLSLIVGAGIGSMAVSKKARAVFSNTMQKAYETAEKMAKEFEKNSETKTETNEGDEDV